MAPAVDLLAGDADGNKEPDTAISGEEIVEEASPLNEEAEAIVENTQPQETNKEAVSPHPAIQEQETPEQVSERQVVSQGTIINADIHERIWVNAGPGTGKTYTVIQRLKKMLNDEIDGTILVLCFSRNAVQVIRERLSEALGPTVESLIDDGQLVIRTFDSFATYMLEDELNPAWDYNQRIEAFIKR